MANSYKIPLGVKREGYRQNVWYGSLGQSAILEKELRG